LRGITFIQVNASPIEKERDFSACVQKKTAKPYRVPLDFRGITGKNNQYLHFSSTSLSCVDARYIPFGAQAQAVQKRRQ